MQEDNLQRPVQEWAHDEGAIEIIETQQETPAETAPTWTTIRLKDPPQDAFGRFINHALDDGMFGHMHMALLMLNYYLLKRMCFSGILNLDAHHSLVEYRLQKHY